MGIRYTPIIYQQIKATQPFPKPTKVSRVKFTREKKLKDVEKLRTGNTDIDELDFWKNKLPIITVPRP